MPLSDLDMKEEIYKSFSLIEKGSCEEAAYLRGLLAMNGIESSAIDDKIEVSLAIGELSRSEYILKKYSAFLLFGLKKDIYRGDFVHDEINVFSERVSDEHGCVHRCIRDYKDLDRFLMYDFERLFARGTPATVEYHDSGSRNLAEFVSFKEDKIFAGGIAHDWGDSLRINIFGKESLVNSYMKEFKWFGKLGIDYLSYGKGINDIALTRIPLVDALVKKISSH